MVDHNETDIADKKLLQNEFYCPKLFEIVSERLYLMPLWSGVIINFERLSNNPAENWIGQVKNKLVRRKRASSSEIITPIYKRILTKFIKNYLPGKEGSDELCELFGLNEQSRKIIKNLIEEKWGEKWTNQKSERKKG